MVKYKWLEKKYNNTGDIMRIDWKKLIIITVITFIVGTFFSFFTMNSMDTFKDLSKPINVPGVLFPIVWSILYLLMSISCYLIVQSNDKDKKEGIILYAIQLVINSLWTLIFFGFGAYLLSFIWIIILLIVVIIMLAKFYNINKIAMYINIPYVLWLLFAAYLNLGIYLLNK